MESEEFQLLPVNQLVDIISSDELNVRSEEQVFNAVMAWVRYNIQERRPHLSTVSPSFFSPSLLHVLSLIYCCVSQTSLYSHPGKGTQLAFRDGVITIQVYSSMATLNMHQYEYSISAVALINQTPWGGSTFQPLNPPGILMGCRCNR